MSAREQGHEVAILSVSELPVLETAATKLEGVKLRVFLHEAMGADEYWLAHTEFPPGSRHRVHRHPGRDQAIYVLSGQLVETGAEGTLRTLSAGDVLHVPAGTWHGLENHGAEPAFTLALYGGSGSAEAAGYQLRSEQRGADDEQGGSGETVAPRPGDARSAAG